jgi:NhaP-type Na+/H+ or K+/H+ antiporter
MALGVLIGPGVLDWMPAAWDGVLETTSRAAFVVLLLRAGLDLPPGVLRTVAVPALVFGTVPVAAEFAVVTGLARVFLFDHWVLALLAGVLVAAVSPAVILPTMLSRKKRGWGSARMVPDRIIGQTLVNAILAQTGILCLLAVLDPGRSAQGAVWSLAAFPLAVVGGGAVGVAVGRWGIPRAVLQALPSWAATLVVLGAGLGVYFGCGLLGLEAVVAALAAGVAVRVRLPDGAPGIRAGLHRVWQVAEVVLFVNLGSQIDLSGLSRSDLVLSLLAVLGVALVARLAVARLLVARTSLTAPERRCVLLAHVPKATIQAVFGALPLLKIREWGLTSMEDAGQVLLLLSALAIVATAPIGACLLERVSARAATGTPSPSSRPGAVAP